MKRPSLFRSRRFTQHTEWLNDDFGFFYTIKKRLRFGATKPKNGDEFSLGRPNRPARPSPSRTGTPKSRPNPALS